MIRSAFVFFCLTSLSLILSSYTQAAEDNYGFEDPRQRKQFLELTESLRCPMCQNQNIADSDAMIAHDMRRKVYQLLSEGKNEQQVIDFMKARYGDFVYYQPPLTPATFFMWVLPVAFILIGALVFIANRRSSSVTRENEKEHSLIKANQLLNKE